MSRYGGQITTSRCGEHPINPRNSSKKNLVSVGFLYIFQFPAIVDVLILNSCYERRRASAGLNRDDSVARGCGNLLQCRFDRGHDMSGRNAELFDKLPGCSAMSNFSHRQLVSPDAFLRQCCKNSVAEAAVLIVVFDSDDDRARRASGCDQLLAIDRLNAEQVDDANRDRFFLQLLISCQSFEHSDTACNNQRSVFVAFSKYFAFTYGKLLVGIVKDRRFGPSKPQIAGTGVIS